MASGAILDRFRAQHRRSAALYEEAVRLVPGGVTHDARYFKPFPLYVERAAGPRKWDVDGHEIIDFVMGHGALLLGHAHPTLVEAVQRQVERGTHYGASQELELEWARAVRGLLPSAEKVRFTSSGTEATMMALRLARAATGRNGLLKLRHHFHGWGDSVAPGSVAAGGALGAGLPPVLVEAVTVVDQHDTGAQGAALDSGAYAAVICEPSGYSYGRGPMEPSVLEFLRARTRASGTVLIFDEVVTGFRASEGGVQEAVGVRPDLTTLAKVLGGGMPGGAVAGRADLLDQLAFEQEGGSERIPHPGTYNANPLSAAAGVAALREVARGDPIRIANARARQLCAGLNRAIRQAEVAGAAYGQASMVHILLGEEVLPPADDFSWRWDGEGPGASVPTTPEAVRWAFRQALLNHGVDLMGMSALVSCVHSEGDIEESVAAFAAALADLRRENVV